MTLSIGSKYLIDIAPWGIQSVRYLGPSWWLPDSYSRVQNPMTRHTFIIRTEKLKPLLERVK